MIYEIIGYAASILVALSLIMISIVKLRWINLFGCLFFVAYGILIQSLPIILTNSFITIVNILHLRKLYSRGIANIHYLPLHPSKHSLLDEFIDTYREDILRWYPSFVEPSLEENFEQNGGAYLALKGLKAIGFVHYQTCRSYINQAKSHEKALLQEKLEELFPEHTIVLNADYLEPRYRDMGLADILYQELGKKLPEKIRYSLVIGSKENRKNIRFLKRHGYNMINEKEDLILFIRSIERSSN